MLKRAREFFKRRKSPTPKPKTPNKKPNTPTPIPNLHGNVIARIVKMEKSNKVNAQPLSPAEIRRVGKILRPWGYRRRLGLSVGMFASKKPAPLIIPPIRPPPINRSRAVAKPVSGVNKQLSGINLAVPRAYKNTTWRYSVPITSKDFLFFNTFTGPAFTFNPKTGARIPAKANHTYAIRPITSRQNVIDMVKDEAKRIEKLKKRKANALERDPTSYAARMNIPEPMLRKEVEPFMANAGWRYVLMQFSKRKPVYFYNRANGPAFVIDPASGSRRQVNQNAATKNIRSRVTVSKLKPRSSKTNTWNAYMQRATRAQKIVRGKPRVQAKRAEINAAVQNYLNGNKQALNKYNAPTLAWWASGTNWMIGNGTPYIKRAGVWQRHGGGPVNKTMILNNIKTINNTRR